MNLVKLQNEIHQQNKDMGWWDEPRTFDVFVCLFHSELSEAMEGDRKNLMDDHLPHYEMFWVELADFVIRVMDCLGSEGNTEYNCTVLGVESTRTRLLAEQHRLVTDAYSRSEDPYYGPRKHYLTTLSSSVVNCLKYAELHNVDLLQIIDEKRAYNLTRDDHKPENRVKANGKKY
jgi:hypothetical protein